MIVTEDKMALIYIDTNIFLDFYQAAKDRFAVFHEIAIRANFVVLPEQTIREFSRNRAARLLAIAKLVQESARHSIYTTSIVRELPQFLEWSKAKDEANAQIKVIANKLREWASDASSDPVYLEFMKLADRAVKLPTTSEAIEKAKTRKILGEPPTSPGKHTIGLVMN